MAKSDGISFKIEMGKLDVIDSFQDKENPDKIICHGKVSYFGGQVKLAGLTTQNIRDWHSLVGQMVVVEGTLDVVTRVKDKFVNTTVSFHPTSITALNK